MKKLLIVGDSFAADWTKKHKGVGWVNMLSNDFKITNVAQAGVSEYKIYKQLEKQNVNEYDHVIISHTSAYRIPVIKHPIHFEDVLHKDCDLIYSDVKEHDSDPIAKIAVDFYENLFDVEYFIFSYNLIVDKIITTYPNAINVTFFDTFKNDKIYGFEDIYLNNKGILNHMNDVGNKIIYKKVKELINE